MANQTTFTQITDGDQLSEGYFNQIRGAYSDAAIFNDINSFNRVSEDMTANNMATTTNFTYSSTPDEFYAKSGASTLETDTVLTSPNPTARVATGANVHWRSYAATIYDECDDSSVDSNLWVPSAEVDSSSENTERAQFVANSGAIESPTVETDPTNGYDFTGSFTAHCYFSMTGRSGVGISVAFWDGSNSVTLTSSTTGSLSGHLVMRHDATNNKIWAWLDGVATAEGVSSSSLASSGLKFRFINRTSVSDTATTNIYNLRYIDGTETTTTTASFSSDAGSNYSTVTNGFASVSSANQGYEMRTKLTSTVASGEVLVVTGVDYQAITDEDY